ncbi:MAG: hypothetical protein GYA62_10055, partial [Bacteroidales bacterium]|nr:hypothetical protein [Bacteroidales bacterium]
GIITISVKKKEILIKFVKSNNNFIFLTLILLGITFSLGPKLNVNGLYTGVPLPYAIFVKYVPIFEMVRGLSRWSFLFYIGLTYFFLSFLIKVNKKVEAFFTILLFLEIIPLNIPTKNDSYITNQDIKLANICSDTPTVVLEIPVTHFDTNGSITDGLSYITKRLLATNYNNCYLVNGYSGYDLPSIQNIKNNLIFSSIESDEKLFYKTIKNTGADLIVINTNNLNPDLYYNLIPTINKLSVKGQVKLLSDNIYKINK